MLRTLFLLVVGCGSLVAGCPGWVVRNFEKCLSDGYQPKTLEGCSVGDGKLSKKGEKSCTRLEGRATTECGFTCAPPPVNGGWGEFGDWSECSAECGGGEQSRTRACDSPAPQHGGAQCEGEATETGACNSDQCPVDCMDVVDLYGERYRGKHAVTKGGLTCQRWDSQSPNGHSRTAEDYPEGGMEENYCRNPDGEDSPWCYNGEGTSPRWDYCEVPRCAAQTGWTPWSNGNMRGDVKSHMCAPNTFVEAMQFREQGGHGLVELTMDCGYGSAFAFTGNGGGGPNPRKTCTDGFSMLQGREQTGYGLVDAHMVCSNGDGTTSNGNTHGWWNNEYACPDGAVITGIQVREQHGYGIINFRSFCSYIP